MPSEKILAKRRVKTQEILDAARLVVNREGLEGLTMARLAKEMDRAVGAMYRYYSGKQALVFALQIESLDRLDDWLKPVANSDDSGVTLVVSILGRYRTFADEYPLDAGLIDIMVGDPRVLLTDEQALDMQDRLTGLLGVLVEALEQAVSQRELCAGDSIQRAYQLWGSQQGLMQFRKRDRLLPSQLHAAVLAEKSAVDLLRSWRP